jgi:threonyl-tRNA synthetase
LTEKIAATLPDGAKIDLDSGTDVGELASRLGQRLKKAALAAKVDGTAVDLDTQLEKNAEVEIITFNSPEGPDIYRHSVSHVMAQAVLELYPEAKLGIGPAIENGFYYDFDLGKSLDPTDLPRIEKRMNKIIQNNLSFKRMEMSRQDAIELFASKGQDYKVELLNEMEDEMVSLYQQGDFIDMCRGPHIPSTGKIKAFKLLKTAGAYWRGDEKRPMLQRIYGTAFDSNKKLEEHLYQLEQAAERDHRKLGKELELFSIEDDFGSGLPLWFPNGALVRRIIEDFWISEHLKRDYEIVMTPHIAKVDLWKTSGHWDFYRENLYSPMQIEDQEYIVKPMNCPGHILIYKSRTRSYREMPLRWAELGTVYRFERSGVLHGLLRVRGFTQDDAHIFCRPDQLQDEISNVIRFCLFMLKTFGFEKYEVFLSTRPEKFVGKLERWQQATNALESALKQVGLDYEIDPGEGVFYGPKIDIKIKDALGRAWQCTTIQVDFNLPERFDITYMGDDNKEHQPIMIHRALLGSLERFMGCLIEHYAGAFPTWIAPVQTMVIPIADRHVPYAEGVRKELLEHGIRSRVDTRSESVSKKIRDAQMQKIPYMLVVGDEEQENKQVALRERIGGDKGKKDLGQFIERIKQEIEDKAVQSSSS